MPLRICEDWIRIRDSAASKTKLSKQYAPGVFFFRPKPTAREMSGWSISTRNLNEDGEQLQGRFSRNEVLKCRLVIYLVVRENYGKDSGD